ncbi:MAG: ATP-binding protein [Nitriliruptoraceae bacterium]
MSPRSQDPDPIVQAPTERSAEELVEDLRVHQVELEVQLEELRRAEEQISALSDRYRTLFARAPVAMLTVGDDGVIRQSNDAARELLAGGEPLTGKPLVLYVVPDDHATLRGMLRHRGQEAQHAQAAFRDRLSTRIPCDVTAIHLDGLDEEREAVLLSLEDRREHERLTTVLAEAERSRAIRQLTGGIAHDFNNLLTVIIGNLSLLEDHVDGEDARRWLTAAQTAGERGGLLVSQLLTYARAQNLTPQACELAPLLEELRPLLDSAVGESVALTVQAPPTLPPVEVDATQLQTSLLNLVLNSRDAHASEVHLTAEPTERGEVRIAVSDDGDGMTAEVAERAVIPFFTTKPRTSSSGLGLAMVASFVEASDGELEIRSEPRIGTTVALTLPTARDGAAPAPRDATDVTREMVARSVLVVEDQPAVREVTADLLEARGLRVHAVADAEAALDHLAEEATDVVLSDVVLGGGMDGLALRRELAADPTAPPVVLISGQVNGRDDVLTKPFTATELVEALHAALTGRGGLV